MMLQGIYISLRSAGNLFCGLRPRNFAFKIFLLLFFFNFYFQLQSTYLQYLQTMYGTYATNKTILYLQNNTYLQCEILTLLTILYSTYNTSLQ